MINLKDKKSREALRHAMMLVTQGPAPGESKWAPVVRRLGRETAIRCIQPLLPDPSKSLTHLAAATLPGLMRMFMKNDVLNSAPVLVEINDPDAATQERITALGLHDTIPEDLEPYVLEVPWELYEEANERNMTLWVMKNAPPDHGGDTSESDDG